MASITPPPDDEIKMFAEDNAHCPMPPARLAARFYHNTSSRRRSSAHSSRRSSLSSSCSHLSKLSCHGGPRSTHIAQHLRRASIIESRKARLADRAAHAEQVRLRAAAAKAQPRVSHSEERALAAAAAKEKLLAEITARCEEEVKRAKKVAEETKERKAAEHARLKEEMAEKFADAARRKTIYQNTLRRPRTTSLAAVEEKKVNAVVLRKLSKGTAAKVIQRAWRAYSSKRVLFNFQTLKLNLATLSEQSFEDVTKLIADHQTIQATARLMKHIGMIGPDDQEDARGAVRVFLSAYLVMAHPMQALSHGGSQPQEQELMTKASALLQPFEVHMQTWEQGRLPSRASSDPHDDLVFAYNDFVSAFDAWKGQDKSVLIEVMVSSFVNMDLIIQSTKDDREGQVADDYFNAVRQEQVKILARLKRLAGPEAALNKVRLAVRKARKQRAKEKREQNTDANVPRATTPMDQLMRDASPLTPPATPEASSRATSAPQFFISRLGQTMTVLPSNREIAHEIQIMGTYEVQQQPWTESRKHFMDSLRRSMRESMESGGVRTAAGWARSMTMLIREKLLTLISQRHPLYERIDGFLDPQLIEQQTRNGAFSYDAFFDTVATMVAQLCSPGRDEAIQAFGADKTSDTIDRLFSWIDILDLMTLDHINFQFRIASKQVLERGHEHEYKMFEQDIQTGATSLNSTKTWWRNSKLALNNNSANGTLIYSRGLVDLVLHNAHFSHEHVPETLQLDYMRLIGIRAKAMQMVAIASILLTTKLRLQRNRESLWNHDKDRLMSADLLSTDPARIISLLETGRNMPTSTRQGLLNFVSRVLPPAIAAAKNAHNFEQHRQTSIEEQKLFDPSTIPTHKISSDDLFTEQIATYVLKSLREHIYARLSASSTAEKVRATTSAAQVLARAGMGEFVTEVGQMVEMLEKIRTVDLRAHEKWYDLVARQVQDELSV